MAVIDKVFDYLANAWREYPRVVMISLALDILIGWGMLQTFALARDLEDFKVVSSEGIQEIHANTASNRLGVGVVRLELKRYSIEHQILALNGQVAVYERERVNGVFTDSDANILASLQGQLAIKKRDLAATDRALERELIKLSDTARRS